MGGQRWTKRCCTWRSQRRCPCTYLEAWRLAGCSTLNSQHGHEEVHQEGGEGISRVEPEEQVRVSGEQGQGDQGQAEDGTMGPGLRRTRQEKMDKDFLYF